MIRIKELRKGKGLSQADLAKILFVNQTAVSQWERGATMPSPTMLNTLADYFHVTTDFLLGRDVPASSEKEQKEKPAENDGLADDERRLLMLFRQLNEEARDRLIDLADDMVQSGKYAQKSNAAVMAAKEVF